MMLKINPIGIIHSPFNSVEGMPIQPTGATGIQGTIEIYDEYVPGLKDLEGFSHLILLYYFHQCSVKKLTVIPFMDSVERGIFATRAPSRPNPVGLSVVKLLNKDANTLFIEDVDILNATPLLDIKPYVPEFDSRTDVRTGWLEKSNNHVKTKKSDQRFK